jgi:hypothetical protein
MSMHVHVLRAYGGVPQHLPALVVRPQQAHTPDVAARVRALHVRGLPRSQRNEGVRRDAHWLKVFSDFDWRWIWGGALRVKAHRSPSLDQELCRAVPLSLCFETAYAAEEFLAFTSTSERSLELQVRTINSCRDAGDDTSPSFVRVIPAVCNARSRQRWSK